MSNFSTIPDSSNMHTRYPIDVTVQHKGGPAYTGVIRVLFAVDSTGVGTTFHSLDTLGFRNVVGFTASDTIHFRSTDSVSTTNGYSKGNNVIVFWPLVPGATSIDSLKKTIGTQWGVGIRENSSLLHATLYPNPVEKAFNLLIEGRNELPEHVRIFGLDGRLLQVIEYGTNMEVSNLPIGVYILKAKFKNEEELHLKFIKH